MFKKRICLLALFAVFLAAPPGAMEVTEAADRILFIPHDNRPISGEEAAEVAASAGVEVDMPSKEVLGNLAFPGDNEGIWNWFEANVHGAKAAVIASDSLLYGSLVASRKHELSEEVIEERIERLAKIKRREPQLNLYVFTSLMRTPRSGLYAGREEPDYYQPYGAAIFSYTALLDKQEEKGLSSKESRELEKLRRNLPPEVIGDWLGRRAKNLAATKQLVDLARSGAFKYLVIGKDDCAPLSQTHREQRELAAYAADMDDARFQLLAGTDEFGMLLLTRAVNDLTGKIPFVYTAFNTGKGGQTVPNYSDEPIEKSIGAAITIAGGMSVNSPQRADLVLLVNTNPGGQTGEANFVRGGHSILNNGKQRRGTRHFVGMVTQAVDSGKQVAVADVAFTNGADNAMMEELRAMNLLFRISAYSGWNTATNSSGFVLGTGMLADRMTPAAKDRLLLTRYLDDWGYQANVRTQMEDELGGFREGNVYANLGNREKGAVERITYLLRDFAAKNLPPFEGLSGLTATLPWHRMFEVEVSY